MANFVYNISKGRVAELANRVNANDPTNSILIVHPFNTTATDAVLIDLNDIAAIEADANTAEITPTATFRKLLDQTGGVTVTTDDTNDRVDVDIPDQTWTAVTGTAWTDLIFSYDNDSTVTAEASLVPLTQHDFAITPDGSDITAQVAVFYRAS